MGVLYAVGVMPNSRCWYPIQGVGVHVAECGGTVCPKDIREACFGPCVVATAYTAVINLINISNSVLEQMLSTLTVADLHWHLHLHMPDHVTASQNHIIQQPEWGFVAKKDCRRQD